MKGFTDSQLARIMEDMVQACTTPEHTDEKEIVNALKQITEGAIEVLDNKKIVSKLKNKLEQFDMNREEDKLPENLERFVDEVAAIVWFKGNKTKKGITYDDS